LEQRLAALQPCAELKKDLGLGVTVGIDKLKSIRLSRAEAVTEGNAVSIRLTGALACQTPDSAAVKGDASVSLEASAVVELTACRVQSLQIAPSAFGGSFGPALEALWQPLIAPKLKQNGEAMLRKACTDLLDGQ
jgi:hypothetical protein